MQGALRKKLTLRRVRYVYRVQDRGDTEQLRALGRQLKAREHKHLQYIADLRAVTQILTSTPF